MLDPLLFLVAGSFVVYAAALILTRLLGPTEILPFRSRAEYLEAALEMDLDLFIERAKVTPRSVIEKLPPEPIQLAGISSAVPSLLAMLSLPVKSDSEILQPKSEPGKWFRVKKGALAGMLVRRSAHPSKDNLYDAYDAASGHVVISRLVLEPAYPKGGEWWRWTSYDLGLARAMNLLPFRWEESEVGDSPYIGQVRAGLLEPVNFGHGDKNQA